MASTRESADLKVQAVQDRGCLSAAKFFYHLPSPVRRESAAGFEGCDVVLREFSKIVPLAKDLISVRSAGQFQADLVVGGSRIVVHFDGSADTLPLEAMDAFDRRLDDLGYGAVEYWHATKRACGTCPTGLLKGCPGDQSGGRPEREKPVVLMSRPPRRPALASVCETTSDPVAGNFSSSG